MLKSTYDSLKFEMFAEYLLTEHIELFYKQKVKNLFLIRL